MLTWATGGWWPDRLLVPALGLALAVAIIAALSLAGSVFLSSTANGIAVFMVFGAGLVAGLLGQIGEALASGTLQNVAKVASWLLPFEGLYQAALAGLTRRHHRLHADRDRPRPVRRRAVRRPRAVAVGGRLPGARRRVGAARLREAGPVKRPLVEVDVFTEAPYAGNPVAVVLDGEGLDTEEMQRFANWTNLSETTFVLPPEAAEADYRVRIFTPVPELPFAGHPTLGTCHAWLAGRAEAPETVVQECAAGLVTVRRTPAGLAFAAPPLLRSGPVEEALVEEIAAVLQIDRAAIDDAQWADNGPGWVAVLLASAEAVLAVSPRFADLDLGLVGPLPAGLARGDRGARVLPQGRQPRRGPGDGEPERLARRVAAAHGPPHGALRRPPGHRARPQRPRPRVPGRRRHDLGRRRHGHLRRRRGRAVSR